MRGRLGATALAGTTTLFVGLLAGTTLLFVGLDVGLGAGPAQAHTHLVSTDPAAGSQQATAPRAVTLRFEAAVGLPARALEVLDGAGRRVAAGRPYHPGPDGTRTGTGTGTGTDTGTGTRTGTGTGTGTGSSAGLADRDTVRVDLPAGLPAGSYGVRWRVVSADGHPLAGTFSFGVGVPAAAAPDPATGTPVVATLHVAAALGAYAGAVLVVGVAFFALVVSPAGRAEPRPQALLRAGWWLSVGSAVALYVLQGPLDAGAGLLDLRDVGLLEQTLTTRPGVMLAVRLFVLGLAAASGPWPGTEPVNALRRNAGALALLFLPTFSLAGHSGEGPLAAVSAVTDTVHLAAAGVWLGGLAVLVSLPVTPPVALTPLWARWTTSARGAVAALVVTGAFQAWRQVPTPQDLTGTDYGRLLLAKLALVALMLAFADRARRWLRPTTTPWLRRSVATELALGLVVLTLTGLLVSRPPAREPEAFTRTAVVVAPRHFS